ncbi:MAG: hypothetical protein AAB426_06550 [Myxococcota bacterium]
MESSTVRRSEEISALYQAMQAAVRKAEAQQDKSAVAGELAKNIEGIGAPVALANSGVVGEALARLKPAELQTVRALFSSDTFEREMSRNGAIAYSSAALRALTQAEARMSGTAGLTGAALQNRLAQEFASSAPVSAAADSARTGGKAEKTEAQKLEAWAEAGASGEGFDAQLAQMKATLADGKALLAQEKQAIKELRAAVKRATGDDQQQLEQILSAKTTLVHNLEQELKQGAKQIKAVEQGLAKVQHGSRDLAHAIKPRKLDPALQALHGDTDIAPEQLAAIQSKLREAYANPEIQKLVAEHGPEAKSAIETMQAGQKPSKQQTDALIAALTSSAMGVAGPGDGPGNVVYYPPGQRTGVGIPDDYLNALPLSAQQTGRAFYKAKADYYRDAERTHHEILSLLASGGRIEDVLFLVMALLSKQAERKLMLKMSEVNFTSSLSIAKSHGSDRQQALVRLKIGGLSDEDIAAINNIENGGLEKKPELEKRLRERFGANDDDIKLLKDLHYDKKFEDAIGVFDAEVGTSAEIKAQELSIAMQDYQQMTGAISNIISTIQKMLEAITQKI